MSAPQIGAQFGSISNNGTGGDVNNQTSNVPGQGYPGEYYSHHSNESSPTSPSMSSSEVDIQNSNLTTSNCDCNQISDVQEMTPTNSAPGESSGDSPADSASSAASSSSSSSSSRK